MSRWFVGSSSMSRFTSERMSMHSLSRLCSPPESVPTALSASSPVKPKAPRLSRASCIVQWHSSMTVSAAESAGSRNLTICGR